MLLLYLAKRKSHHVTTSQCQNVQHASIGLQIAPNCLCLQHRQQKITNTTVTKKPVHKMSTAGLDACCWWRCQWQVAADPTWPTPLSVCFTSSRSAMCVLYALGSNAHALINLIHIWRIWMPQLKWDNSGVSVNNNSVVARVRQALQVVWGNLETVIQLR